MSNVRTLVASCTVTGFGFAGRNRSKMVVQLRFADGTVSACATTSIATSALLQLCQSRHPRSFAFDVPSEGQVEMRFPTKREVRGDRPVPEAVRQALDERSPSTRPTDAAIHSIAPAFA